MLKKITLAIAGLLMTVAGALSIATPAFAVVQGNVSWFNFGAGANQSPVAVTYQWPGSTTEEIDLTFTGVRFNPSGFVSSQGNQISSNSCTLVGVTNGTISVVNSGIALSGLCAGDNSPNASFGIVDQSIAGNTVTITFPAGSLQVTDANNATLEIDGIDSGSNQESTIINLSALAPTPTPTPTPTSSPAALPETGAVNNSQFGILGFILIAGGLSLAIAAKLLPKKELAKK